MMIAAGKGDVQAARGLIGRAIKQTLKVRKWGESPHFVWYESGSALARDTGGNLDTGQYRLEVTREEFARLMAALETMARAEGWSNTPVDAYHD